MNFEVGDLVRLRRVTIYNDFNVRYGPGTVGQIRTITFEGPTGAKLKRPQFLVSFPTLVARLDEEEIEPLSLLEVLALVAAGEVEIEEI